MFEQMPQNSKCQYLPGKWHRARSRAMQKLLIKGGFWSLIILTRGSSMDTGAGEKNMIEIHKVKPQCETN